MKKQANKETEDLEEAKANAELICKAVNERQHLLNQIETEAQYSSLVKDENEGLKQERQRLIDSNRELVEGLEAIKMRSANNAVIFELINRLLENNAKNLLP